MNRFEPRPFTAADLKEARLFTDPEMPVKDTVGRVKKQRLQESLDLLLAEGSAEDKINWILARIAADLDLNIPSGQSGTDLQEETPSPPP